MAILRIEVLPFDRARDVRLSSGVLKWSGQRFVILAVIALAITGLFRLRFETDVLAVLPENQPSIEALRLVRAQFEDEKRIAVLMQHPEEIFEEDAEALAEILQKKLPEATIEYGATFQSDPSSISESVAAVWSQAGEEEVASMVNLLTDGEALDAHLREVKRELGTSLDGEATALASYDPLGFLNLPVLENLRDTGFDYSSEDGTLRLVMVIREDLGTDYQEQAAWVAQVRAALPDWSEDGIEFQLTGGPVFGSEVGAGMEKDMVGTIAATSLLVGLLFLVVQRDIRQLLALGVVLLMVFAVTLGIGGWLYGSLNLVSVGFAAILLGLVIDYAVVIAREAHGVPAARELRRELAPAVVWAAATTAAVFGVLGLSSFPGVQQLGGLIVIGLLAGAFLMLLVMPLFLSKLSPAPASRLLKAPFFGDRFATGLLVALFLFSGMVFLFKGLPTVTFDSQVAQPRDSEAASAFRKIQEGFPAWSDENWQLVASASSTTELALQSEMITEQLVQLKASGALRSYQWPSELIPDEAAFERHRELWASAASRQSAVLMSLEAAGFSERGRALTKEILAVLPNPLTMEDSFTALFIKDGPAGDKVMSGRLLLSENQAERVLGVFSGARDSHATVTGWPVLQRVTLPLVQRDFRVLFIPAALILIAALLLVFRSWREALIPAVVMVLSLALINVLLLLRGEPWNFLNSMAIPLIVGTGIDYGIHLIYALRRNEGDFGKVWNGVGKAICFCGLSSAVGFGSLMFASNDAVSGMGRLCSAGVLITMSLSLLTIPALWHRFGHSPELTGASGEL